jgi:hypothetical protein
MPVNSVSSHRSQLACLFRRRPRPVVAAMGVATVDTLFRLDDHMRRTDEGFHYGHRRLVARPWPRKV